MNHGNVIDTRRVQVPLRNPLRVFANFRDVSRVRFDAAIEPETESILLTVSEPRR